MTKRYFTVAEVDVLLPHLEALLGRVLRVRLQLRAVSEHFLRLGEPFTEENLVRQRRRWDPPELTRVRGQARALREMLAEDLEAIERTGVHIKDLDTGLCDFVARYNGRDVLLCWRLGEKRVKFWHELNSGYGGRRPIDGASDRFVH